MSENFRHVLFPALLPLAFLALVLMPVEVIGCRNRGILALVIALTSGGAAIACSIRALKLKRLGSPDSARWVVSSLILTVPVVALIVLA